MILVTGATGNLGSSVVQQLKKHISNEDFIVTSSNQEGVELLTSQGLKARLANFNNQKTLDIAFKGITKLLLISTMDKSRFEQHKKVIDAAKNQGVLHIVYTSLAIRDIQTSGVKDLMISHFQTEDYIKESGLVYTILRNTMYADALLQILGPNVLEKGINIPGGNGKVPYALRREMGEATANLLLQEGLGNRTYDFTGSKSFSYAEVASELSKLSGKTVLYNNITDDNFKSNLKETGLPDFVIFLHSGTIYDIKTHQYEIESKTLEELLGRKTASLDSFMTELFKI
ncbi:MULTISPECIES: SDR family oxidoreductase [unclassified Sphingobacterium]|uniref:SDR family oxidoreductase n=1 Tax=unclassified Sphingobacterium TaxID=2609468 RepID=UPI0025CF7BA4|nr:MULTISPECIES: SDR family oxidoreductase [unclassified Sphingobacterium]